MSSTRALFQYQHPDSTRDLNKRHSGLAIKGLYDSGATDPSGATGVTTQVVFPYGSQLAVEIGAFVGIGSDGMVFVHDAPPNKVLEVQANRVNYILFRSAYNASGPADLAFEVMSSTDWNALVPSDKAKRVILAKVDLGLGATQVNPEDIDLTENDLVDPADRDFIRGQVDDFSELPVDGAGEIVRVRVNDVYLVRNDRQFYLWDGAAWVTVTDGALDGRVTALENNRVLRAGDTMTGPLVIQPTSGVPLTATAPNNSIGIVATGGNASVGVVGGYFTGGTGTSTIGGAALFAAGGNGPTWGGSGVYGAGGNGTGGSGDGGHGVIGAGGNNNGTGYEGFGVVGIANGVAIPSPTSGIHSTGVYGEGAHSQPGVFGQGATGAGADINGGTGVVGSGGPADVGGNGGVGGAFYAGAGAGGDEGKGVIGVGAFPAAEPSSSVMPGVGVYGTGIVGVYGLGVGTSNPGVEGTGSSPAGEGVRGNGTGSGHGVEGFGGSGGGAGVRGEGGALNGHGVVGQGTAFGFGGVFTGGSSGAVGIEATGDGGGGGVVGNGDGAGAGVTGNGGLTGNGVEGIGGGTSGSGVVGTGTAVGSVGVEGTAGSGGVGVAGIGTGGSSTGVWGSITATNSFGVLGEATFANSNGVRGNATTAGSVGVYGNASGDATAIGVVALATAPATEALRVSGKHVWIDGGRAQYTMSGSQTLAAGFASILSTTTTDFEQPAVGGPSKSGTNISLPIGLYRVSFKMLVYGTAIVTTRTVSAKARLATVDIAGSLAETTISNNGIVTLSNTFFVDVTSISNLDFQANTTVDGNPDPFVANNSTVTIERIPRWA